MFYCFKYCRSTTSELLIVPIGLDILTEFSIIVIVGPILLYIHVWWINIHIHIWRRWRLWWWRTFWIASVWYIVHSHGCHLVNILEWQSSQVANADVNLVNKLCSSSTDLLLTVTSQVGPPAGSGRNHSKHAITYTTFYLYNGRRPCKNTGHGHHKWNNI